MAVDPAMTSEDAERLSALGATFHDVRYVIRLGSECGFEYLSDSVVHLVGYPAARFRAEPSLALRLLVPEDHVVWQTVTAAPAEAVRAVTLRWQSVSGGVVWADVRCAKHRRADGSVAIYGVARDVTERMATEQALRSGHERMRLLLEHATDVVFDIAPDGTFRWVSASSERVLGWKPAEMVARPAARFIHPDDRSATGDARDRPTRGVSRVARFRVLTADGGFRWMSGVARQVAGPNGAMQGWVAGLRDVDKEVRAEAALRASEEHFRLLAEYGSDLVFRSTPDGTPQWVSPSVKEILGWEPEDLIGQDIRRLIHPDDLVRATEMGDRVNAGERADVEVRLRTAAGTYRWVGMVARPVLDAQGRVVARVGSARDIQREVEARRALARSELRFRLAMESAPVGMAILDLGRRFLQVNPALCRMLGRSAEWLLAKGMADILPDSFDEEDRRLRGELLAGRTRAATSEVRILGPAGEEIWAEHSIGLLLDPDGTPQSYVSQFFDVTDAKRGREQLAYLADHDAVTRLLSRRALLAALERIDAHPPRTGTRTGALFIDIDRFKDVNDTHGHAVGDQVLAAVAGRISGSARSDDLVARLGGDEIVVALPNLHRIEDAEAVAAKIHAALAQPVAAGATTARVTVSIGVALREEGEDVERVITKADRALYRAKRSGRNRTVRYDPRVDEP